MSIEESDFFSDHETLVSMKILSKQVDINYALMTLFLNPNLLLQKPCFLFMSISYNSYCIGKSKQRSY